MKQVKNRLKPVFLAGGFGLFMAALYFVGAFEYFKWSVWKEIHMDIKEFVTIYPLKAFILAIGLYLIALLTFLPGMLLFDLVIGYMFPKVAGMLIIMTGSVIGALIIVFACRFGFKNYLLKDDNKLLQKIKTGFSENETLYLLFLRFVPFFPFALVSAALSTLKVSYKKIAITTFFGMLPIAFILTTVGNSLGDLMKLDHMPHLSELLSPTMMAALCGLCGLSLLPILLKKFAKN
ncbi:MAG: hypothetical protein S4CHLAM20_10340 [Chlamydiia bacterium]|nr:hypothetical protein [Chlamydiia bacterium]